MNEIITSKNELTSQIIEQIKQTELAMKLIKSQQDEYKAKLAEIMGERGIQSFENDTFKITYFPESEKASLDTTKLKEEYEEVYIKCQKLSQTKHFVKVVLK